MINNDEKVFEVYNSAKQSLQKVHFENMKKNPPAFSTEASDGYILMVIPQSFVHKKSDVAGTGPRESFPRFLHIFLLYQGISLLEFTAQCGRRGKRQVEQICMLISTWFEKGFVLKKCGVSGRR